MAPSGLQRGTVSQCALGDPVVGGLVEPLPQRRRQRLVRGFDRGRSSVLEPFQGIASPIVAGLSSFIH